MMNICIVDVGVLSTQKENCIIFYLKKGRFHGTLMLYAKSSIYMLKLVDSLTAVLSACTTNEVERRAHLIM
jgi:hypothetical protein